MVGDKQDLAQDCVSGCVGELAVEVGGGVEHQRLQRCQVLLESGDCLSAHRLSVAWLPGAGQYPCGQSGD